MKEGTVIAIIVAGVALIFLAVSRGWLGTGVGPTGIVTAPAPGQHGAIVTPQPTTNYSGYLAASTAPGVSNALNSALSGIGNLFTGWFGSSPAAPAPGQSASGSSPTMSAQPSGPSPSTLAAQAAEGMNTPVGPQVSQGVSYDATAQSAYDWLGLTADNAYDPSYSLQETA